jgi:hypothetical protein
MTDIRQSTRVNPDGSTTVTTSMTLGADTSMRPVRDDVVEAYDNALGQFGEVMHAMDPSRLVDFDGGGPPVWSVGLVRVTGPTPYTLLLTYGFSEILSPSAFRRGLRHEYSLAIPDGAPVSPWADAFLRYVTRYVLDARADVKVNDVVPLRDRATGEQLPMTRAPFPRQYHAELPDSNLVGYMATQDPVLPVIETPHGDVEVRRILGIDAKELDRVETWDPAGFIEEMRAINGLLLTAPVRASAMDHAGFRERVNQRFGKEGSTMDSLVVDLRWTVAKAGRKQRIELVFPSGAARERLANAISGRVGMGRPLVLFSIGSPPLQLVTDPAQTADAFSTYPDGSGRIVFAERSMNRGALLMAVRRAPSCLMEL